MGSPCTTSTSAPSTSRAATSSPTPGATIEGRVVAGDAGEVPGQQVVGQLARRQRQAEPDHVLQLRQTADDEVAVAVLGRGRLAVAGRAVIDEVGGHGAGRAARLHVEQEVADHEGLLGCHAHRRGGV